MTRCLLCLRILDGHDPAGSMPPICGDCYDQTNELPPVKRMAILLKAQQIHDDRKKIDSLSDIIAMGGDFTSIIDKAQKQQEKIEDSDNWWRGDEDDEDDD